MDRINSRVLVLNQNFEPLDLCSARRALVLLWQGKAEMMANGSGNIRTARFSISLPSVIRLLRYIRKPRIQKRLTRMEIFSRDHFRCQYCGKESGELTLDHVMPRYRGGKQSWENMVSACIPCNRKKAGRTPLEAGMHLLSIPKAPPSNGFMIPYYYMSGHQEWQQFLPQSAWGGGFS